MKLVLTDLKAEVQKDIMDRFCELVQKKDINGLLELYAEDVIYFAPNKSTNYEGRAGRFRPVTTLDKILILPHPFSITSKFCSIQYFFYKLCFIYFIYFT